MGVEVFDSAIESGYSVDDAFKLDSARDDKSHLDARRRLEEKLEEMRLQKELREYDFDL